MADEEDRMRVLQELEAGEIGVADAVRRLEEASPGAGRPSLEGPRAEGWWLIPFGTGLGLSASGGWLASQGGWWWLLAAPLLLIGIPVLIVGVLSTETPWLQVRVHHARGRISMAFPIPIHAAAWATRAARPWVQETDALRAFDFVEELATQVEGGGVWSVDIDATSGPRGRWSHRERWGRPQ